MRIEIKRNLIIFYYPRDWEEISAKIIAEHGTSMLISWKMKRELGVTVRRHKGLMPIGNEESISDYAKGRYYYDDQIHLDFWSEAAMSFFMLKYLN